MIELLFVVGLLSVVLFSIYAMNLQLAKGTSQIADLGALRNYRDLLASHIFNDDAWSITVTKNPGMSCLNGSGTLCASPTKFKFDLYDSGGNLVHSTTNKNDGITPQGLRCGPNAGPNPHDARLPNPLVNARFPSAECPWRYVLEWAALDKNTYPVAVIFLTLKDGRDQVAKPPVPLTVNPQNHGWTVGDLSWPGLVPPPYNPKKPYREPTLLYRTTKF